MGVSRCRSTMRLFVVLPLLALCASGALPKGDTPLAKCPIAQKRSRSNSHQSVDMVFRNSCKFAVDLYWVDTDGQETQGDEISVGNTVERGTFPGHVFRARQQGSGILLFEEEAGESPLNSATIQTCIGAAAYKSKDSFKVSGQSAATMEQLLHDQAAACEPAGQSAKWSCVRTVSPIEVAARDGHKYGFHEDDKLASDSACKVHRKVGDTSDNGYSHKNHRDSIKRVTKGPGYLKMSIDPDLFQLIKWWSGNSSHFWLSESKTSRSYEKAESIAGCYANTHQFPFSRLDLDKFQRIRRGVVAHMKQVLEWWTERPLEHTSTYGMRIYHREAMLLNHVDRGDTHIASAVLQVHQTTDPNGGWPLEVVGEDGVVREVYLQPGEMVLYEGARLLHGRPMRFQGDHFGNIFTHFKPQVYDDNIDDDDL